jgi:hypothetical protein
LGGLEMGVGEGGFGFPLQGEGGEVREDFGEFGEEKVHGVAHEDELGIVGHVAARCLEMLLVHGHSQMPHVRIPSSHVTVISPCL